MEKGQNSGKKNKREVERSPLHVWGIPERKARGTALRRGDGSLEGELI